MNYKKTLQFILICILLSPTLSFANCIEEQLLKISQNIKYPSIYWENDIEDTVAIYITKDSIELIEGKLSASKQELLDKAIIEKLSECPLEEYPRKFLFQFKLGEIDTFYIVKNNLIFQRKAIEYFAIPASTSCDIYTNSKMVIKKNKEKHRSRAIIKAGNKIVFQYHYEGETNPYNYYNDNEKNSIITFQINDEFEKFEYRDGDLKKIKLHYEQISNTTSVRTYVKKTIFGTKVVSEYNYHQGLIHKGYVKGYRIDDISWIIEIKFGDLSIKDKFIIK